MVSKYLIERSSWIIFYLLIHFFIVFVAYVDSTIPLIPILYIIFLSLMLFCIFIVLRYKKETKFYKSLADREDNLDLTNIAEPESPFERIIENSIANQTNLLKQESLHNRTILEQEKDELLSWIHEVKTPLTAMHLMIRRVEDETLKSHLTFEWLRIHLLLDQQLHQRRIPFIENDVYMERVDLAVLIYDEIKTLQSWCIQKGIGFNFDLHVTEIISDAKWLGFILRQLLTNAVKYSEASEIEVQSHESDEHIILKLKDMGQGIDPRDLPRIFDKGFTSTSRHQDHAATGMGLYLAKKAAQSLNIIIMIDSSPGLGTAVTLTFPKKNEFVRITSM